MILNLVHKSVSQIPYTVIKFPDGQQSIVIDVTVYDEDDVYNIQIVSRLNSFKDLELIICATQALRNIGFKNISLFVPYFLGSRSDRVFTRGGVNYLKQVICPIINSQNFTKVVVYDPHSDVLEACLNNYRKMDNLSLVRWSLPDIGDTDTICLVSPDAGAYKKIFDVAKATRITRIITANKVRDMKTGNIIRTEIPVLDQHTDLKYVIVDDICDGGRTFVELAKAIKDGRPTAKIYLIVSHGIFSNGLYELSTYFEKIYSTNSYSDIDVDIFSDFTVQKDFLKQYNLF